MALSLCKAVTVYGFGDGGKQNYQYYTFYNTERKFGNTEVHSFDAEKVVMAPASGAIAALQHFYFLLVQLLVLPADVPRRFLARALMEYDRNH